MRSLMMKKARLTMISKYKSAKRENFDLTNKHYAKEIDPLKILFNMHSDFVYLIYVLNFILFLSFE